MNKISHQKTCLGLTAIVSFLGIAGIAIAAVIAIVGFTFVVQLLDEVTKSIDDQPTGEAFFASTGGWDYKRIALVEPYQAISTNESWSVDLKADPVRAAGATKLDVIDKKIIVVYGTDKLYEGERFDEVWFIIIPEENIEEGFIAEEEFLAYFDGRGIQTLNLRDVDELYQELGNIGYLEWFPEAYKK